jgi:hypothetical protein
VQPCAAEGGRRPLVAGYMRDEVERVSAGRTQRDGSLLAVWQGRRGIALASEESQHLKAPLATFLIFGEDGHGTSQQAQDCIRAEPTALYFPDFCARLSVF